MSFNYKNPITPLSTLGNISVQRQNVFGTNFSILSTGGYMEVYNINELYYTIPPSTTGLIEYSGNSIPIQLNKGTGSPFSFDVLTLNSDNISSGRRRLGMLVYVIDEDQIYQYQIPNFTSLWNSATGATGPGGNTVVFSDFGTTVKGNTPEGLSFISAWTSNIIEGVSGGTSINSVWKKLVTGGGGTFTGGTVTGNTIFTSGLTANTFSASTYLGLPGDIFITGGTFDTNTDTLTLDRSSGSSITITGFTDYYTTAFTYNDNTFTIYNNSGNTFDATFNDVTGLTVNGILSASTISGGTFYGDGSNLTNVLTGATNIGTGLTLSNVIGGNTLEVNSITGDPLNKITTTLSGDTIQIGINEQNLSLWNLVVQGNRLLDGSVTWVSGLTFYVSDLQYLIGGTIYSASSTTVILQSGDTNFDRIDVIYADTGSTVGVLTGTPSNNPEKPIVDGDTQVEVTFVSVPANSTGATVTGFTIYDENTGTAGGEWNFLAYGGQSSKLNPNFTGVTYSGSKSISITGATGTTNYGFYLSASTPIDITEYSSLQFSLRNINSLGTNTRLYIYLLGAGGVISSVYTQVLWSGTTSFPNNITYSPTNTSTWQLISIPLWRFYASNNSVYGIIVRPYNATVTQSANLYLDKFQFVGGIPVNPPSNAWLGIQGDSTATTLLPSSPNSTLIISGGTNIGSVVTSPNRVNINLDNNISLNGVTATTLSGRTLTIQSGVTANTVTVSSGITTGTLRVTSGATNGYILTSDGSGNATWQAVASPSATTISIDPVLLITSTPPISPNDGDRYLVSSASTGSFLGQTNNIAEWDGLSWNFYIPSTDDIVYVSGVLLTYRFNGSLLSSFKWEVYGLGVAILQNGNTFNGPMFIGTNDNQIVNIKSSGETRMFISPSNGVTIGRNQSTNPSNVFLKIGGTDGQSNISTGGDGFITFGKIGATKQWGFSLNSVGAALTTTNATMYAGSVGVNTTPSHGLGTVINAVGTTTRGNLDFTNLGNLNARFFPDSITFSPLASNGLSIIGGSINTTRNSFVFTSPTSINLNPSTELIGADFNFSNAIGHQGGNIPLQRDFVLRNRRHNYNSASTINESYTMWIGGAPIVGTNANILENWALGVGGDTNITGKTKTINFQMTSGATNGYILTSDGSGNASWSPLSGTTGYSSTYSAGILLNSSGWTSTGTGQINLPQVDVALFNNPNFIEPVSVYTISSGTTGVLSIPPLQDNDTNYIIIEYNGGSPRYNVLNNDGTINDSDVVLYLIVYRAGNFIHVLDFGNQGAGLPNKLNDRVIMTDRFARESGFSLGLSGSTGVVTLTSGVAWNGTNRQTLVGVNSQDDIFFKNFHSGGTWVYTTTGNTLNNEYYDDGTNPVLATAGKYLVNWYFRGQEVNDHLYEVYGTDEYDSVSEAQLSVEPTLPELITSHAFLTGRIIVQVSATTGYVESAFVRVFQSTTVTEHNDLLGLQGGLGGQYYHLNSNQYNNLPLLNSNNVFQSGLTANTISSTTINTVSLGTSANCITDLFVNNINSCSPLHIQPINLGDVYIGENGGVNVGIGTLSPTEKLFVSGNTYITGGSSSFLVGNSQPYLARNLTNDFIQLNNDGFGQSVFASPSTITLSVGPVVGNGLKVINTNNLVGNSLSYNFADYLFKSYYSGSTNYFEINHIGFNGDNKFGVNTIPTATIHAKGVDSSSSNFGLKVQDSGGTNNLVVRNDGKVGINTSNPNYQLEVLPKDLTGTTQVVIRNTSTSPNWSPVSLSVIDGSNYGVTMSNSTNGVDTTLNINSGAYSYLNHQVNGNTVATLVTAGNFLLWRLPDNFNFRRLATNGDWINFNSLNQRVSIFNENIGGVTIPSRLGLRGDTNTSSTYSLVIQNSGGTNTLVVRDDGNVGIGTSTPTAKLNIKYEDPFTIIKDLIHIQQNYNSYSVFKITDNGSSNGSQINSEWATWGFGMSADISTGNRISIKGNTSTSGTASIISKNSSDVYTFIVRDDGKVGVGTVSPSETLDVNGKTKTTNFQMTSGATNGYILTSDGSGNASWSPQSGITGSTNTYVTGVTYSANTLTVSQNNGVIPINTTIGLNIKSNTVTAASFTGTPLTYTVIFTTPYPSTNYTITITGSDNRVFTYESKTINGFVINTNANTILTGNVDWQTISIGES